MCCGKVGGNVRREREGDGWVRVCGWRIVRMELDVRSRKGGGEEEGKGGTCRGNVGDRWRCR